MPLSDVEIRNAKPRQKPWRLYDRDGLYVEIAPTGRKWWRLKYRFGGKEKRLALGVYPDIDIKKARRRTVEARGLLGESKDPGAERRQAKIARTQQTENSFEVVAREWIERHMTNKAESHRDRVLSRFERDVFPYIGNRPVADIEPPELLATARRIESRGAIESAHRALGACGQVMRYAVATGRASRDPSRDLKGALAQREKEHFAAITDPGRVAALLRALDGYDGSPVVRCALRLAPLVFVRPGELRQARWEDIDLDAAEWRYLVTKTKTQHIVPLSQQAIEILREVQPLTGQRVFVFPCSRTPHRPMSDNAILAAMRRMGIGKDEMTGHGFRAMARTILDEVLHFRTDYIEHQLAHTVRDSNGRAYNRTAHLSERKAMMQAWADYLDSLWADGNVVPIRRSAAA